MSVRLGRAANVEAPGAPDSGDADRLFIESLSRGFRVLEAFAQKPGPKSLTELAGATGLDKSAIQRSVHTLIKIGYLERTQFGIVPGKKILDRSFDYLMSNPLVLRAIPVLADLRKTVQERVDLSLFDDVTMIYVIRLQSKLHNSYAHLMGRRVPTFCTSGGRAVLSHLPHEQALDILRRSDRKKFTPNTKIEMDDILQSIAEVRKTGYSVAVEEILMGEIAIASAIINQNGIPVGAIHVAGSLAEWTPSKFISKIGPLVAAAANGLRGA